MVEAMGFVEPTAVIVLAGAQSGDRSQQTMAGICRGAATAKAVIIDSGIGSNIEQYC